MRLTRELIKAGMTANMGINKKQCDILGIQYETPFKLKKGWLNSLIGKEISQEVYDQYLEAYNRKRPNLKYDTFSITMLKTEGLRLYRSILNFTTGNISLNESQSWGVEYLLNKLDREFSKQDKI